MADKGIIIDVDGPKHPKLNGHSGSKNIRKRKRTLSWPENLGSHEKEAHIEAYQKELDGLFEYYKEVKDQTLVIELNECGSKNAVIACLMEESELPLSRLVDEIYKKLKKVDGRVVLEPLTYASVKSSVLYVGQRLMYGVPNADADVLEDDSESRFWCWETRDVKLIPKSIRGKFVIRRTCRRRIHERIMAVTETITALKKPDNEQNFKYGLMKAFEKLSKSNTEAEIRSLVDGLLQRNSVDMDKKEAKRQEKLMLKQLERNKRAVEKESKILHSELQKGILLSEKNMNLLQGEDRKEEICREKDSSERRKHQRQQPEVAERDKRRQEKEEAELKKKRSLQKQASIMESFLKRNKTSPSCQNGKLSTKAIPSDLSNRSKNLFESATQSMDCTLASSNEITIEVIRKSHLSSWRYLGQSIHSNRKQGWGLRRKPKTELFKELKLTVTRVVACDNEFGMEKLVDGMGERITDTRLCPTSTDTSLLDIRKCCQGKQLLQFEHGHRPAFYGVWPKKSQVVGPRCPFRKDPNLEYDISSDEEWEEEDPGESLSDCDKDEEESLEECSKSDDDESEDGFFVPDGYLSEDEGAQLEQMGRDIDIEGIGSSPGCKDDIESEEFCALLRQQKYLNSLTEHALRKNQPLIIPNLMHDKASLSLAHNLSGTPKLEQTCLLILSMRVISINLHTEISADKTQNEDQEAFLSNVKGGRAPITDMAAKPAIMESDLPVIVSTIQTSQGINEVLESLQQKFPAVSKSILRNKVCEVSDYVDNSLQVKKEVLVKLGLILCPEKSSRGAQSSTKFFSKRCLPPTGESMNPGETSPLPTVKPGSAVLEGQSWTYRL